MTCGCGVSSDEMFNQKSGSNPMC